MRSVNTYQDIKTPEEEEELRQAQYLREIRRREAAEMRFEAEREERLIREAEKDD